MAQQSKHPDEDFFGNFGSGNQKLKSSESPANSVFKNLGLDNYLDKSVESQARAAQDSVSRASQPTQPVKVFII